MPKTGFSIDGKLQNPQIFINLIVGLGGYVIGYDICEGNIRRTYSYPFLLKKLVRNINLNMLIIFADAGSLSKNIIIALESRGYKYIIGSRLRNEAVDLKNQILADQFIDGTLRSYNK